MNTPLTRRGLLQSAAGTAMLGLTGAASAQARNKEPFIYCLNTSTIRGQKLPMAEKIAIASRAGYQAIEPWVNELEQFVRDGGNLRDLGKRLEDANLRVESVIGFVEWIVEDENRRKKGLEDARRVMDIIRQIGGRRLAAPPAGATKQTDLNLMRAAERYRAMLQIGEKIGVVPQVELWGFSACLSRLGECAFVAMESGHPQACILADVYHLYKGGSGHDGVRLLSGTAMHVLHMNDYPSNPPRALITDAHRVYPGDGVAPLEKLLRDLHTIGFRGALSFEVFNPEYWKQDAAAVARTGIEKMRAVVRKALPG